MIEDWIDDLTAVCGTVRSHTGGQVLSYQLYKRKEIPLAIEKFPCALSYVRDVAPEYSDAGPDELTVNGVTEFHLFPDLSPANIPELMKYYGKILQAFASKRSLGGKVAWVAIVEPGMQFVQLQYGVEAEHHGILVTWQAVETISGDLTLGS